MTDVKLRAVSAACCVNAVVLAVERSLELDDFASLDGNSVGRHYHVLQNAVIAAKPTPSTRV